MKGKGSASLYEVLKAATAGPSASPGSGPSTPPESPPGSSGDGSKPATLKERLAAYKAKKLAAINQTVADATPPPPVAQASLPPAESPTGSAFVAPTILVAPSTPPVPVETDAPETLFEKPAPPPAPEPEPDPEPEPAPPSAPEVRPSRGPGERVIRLTYNTAAFAGLVLIGVVFLAYALGVQAGRRGTAAPESPAPAAAPAAPVKHYSILLAEWPTKSARDRLRANDGAYQLGLAIRRAGLGAPRSETIQRRNQAHLALYLGDFTDPLSEENRKRLMAIRNLKVGNALPFQKAGFEERRR